MTQCSADRIHTRAEQGTSGAWAGHSVQIRQVASRANGARNSPPHLDVALLRLALTLFEIHGAGGRRLGEYKMRTSVVVLALALGCLAVAEAAGAHPHAHRA